MNDETLTPPMNLISWFIDLPLEDKIELFNCINNRNLKRQEDYKKNQQS